MIRRWKIPAIILFGFAVRFLYSIFSHDFWLDEALNYQIAQNNLQTIIRALSFDTWPPLYALFMHYWQKFGQGVLFLRLPSVLFGTLTLILVWHLAKNLFDTENIDNVVGYIHPTGEGKWTIDEAKRLGVSVPVMEDSFRVRMESEKPENQEIFSNKIVALLRKQFGGHEVKYRK